MIIVHCACPPPSNCWNNDGKLCNYLSNHPDKDVYCREGKIFCSYAVLSPQISFFDFEEDKLDNVVLPTGNVDIFEEDF